MNRADFEASLNFNKEEMIQEFKSILQKNASASDKEQRPAAAKDDPVLKQLATLT